MYQDVTWSHWFLEASIPIVSCKSITNNLEESIQINMGCRNSYNAVVHCLLPTISNWIHWRTCLLHILYRSVCWFDIWYCIKLSLAIDIFVIFVSCYHDSCNELVTKSKSIAMNYLTGWFIFDLIAVLPINEIIALTSSDYGWVYLINKSFRLLRLNRINTISREATFLEKSKYKLSTK